MSMRSSLISRCWILFLICSILLSWFPELTSAATVTLDSIEIFTVHEWLTSDPTVYFQCKGENKTYLPDVKKKNSLYTFKGEESWQPLTEFTNKKCKRCGVYEKDALKFDDVYDEWEFCPSDFSDDGKYIHSKDKEFNATFLCLECVPLGTDSARASASHDGRKVMHRALIVLVTVLVSTVVVLALVAGYKYWQKRKKQQEQARFLKLFEDVDEIEDELGIGPLSSVV